jgi:catechol 2,3-dioxygenase-like lactoylglutathione lyase family enzyme
VSELLVNIDVPDLEAALVFYRNAFGLTLSRRLGAQAAELIGWPVRLYLLQQPAGSAAAATDRRATTGTGRRCISTPRWTISTPRWPIPSATASA